MSDIPKSISRIYNQFDAASQQHALVYFVIVKLALIAVANELKDSHPEASRRVNDWVNEMRKA